MALLLERMNENDWDPLGSDTIMENVEKKFG